MRKEATPGGGTADWREGAGGALVDSPAGVTPLMSVEDPLPYGAQHHQDALWKGEKSLYDIHCLLNKKPGGNEALPPLWHQFELAGDAAYQDDDVVMASWDRPLPGVRLGELRKYCREQCTNSQHR